MSADMDDAVDAGLALAKDEHYNDPLIQIALAEMATKAIIAERKRIVAELDMALLDFERNDAEGFARGHAHARAVAMSIVRNERANQHYS